jgi:hypothetical protein
MLKKFKAKLIDLGLSFLILALAISHGTACEISGGRLAQVESMTPETQQELHKAIHFHADLCVSILLERTLRRLLSSITDYLNHPRREDWIPVCFAISLLLMGAESLQVDIYLHGVGTTVAIGAMEGNAIKPLIGLFRESTNGLNPLMIGWDEGQNVDFVAENPDMVYALQDLQGLTQEYCKLRSLYCPGHARVRMS